MKIFIIYLNVLLLFVFLSCTKNTSPTKTDDSYPVITDNQQIAFANSGDIYIIDIDGNSLIQLTKDNYSNSCPQFSSDGKQIIYYSSANGSAQLNIMDINGSNKRKLFDASTSLSGTPLISPNGKYIIHVSGNYGNTSLNICENDGSNHYNLNINIDYNFDFRHYYYSEGVVVSPDETYLLFSSDWYNQGNYDICSLNLNNKQLNNLSIEVNTENDKDPVYSPDGTKIIFSAMDSYSDIYKMDLDGSNAVNLTDSTVGEPYAPFYSPDGSTILFTGQGFLSANSLFKNTMSNMKGSYTLFLMDSEGDSIYQISDPDYAASGDVVFSEDGNYAFYTRYNTLNCVDLTSLDRSIIFEFADLSEITKLSISGRYIYFAKNLNMICRIKEDGSEFKELTLMKNSEEPFVIQPL